MLWLVREAIVAFYPRTDTLPGAADCDLDAFLEKFRREVPPLVWLGVVLGAVLFHLTPILTVHVPLPALWLPRRLLDQHAHLLGSQGYWLRQTTLLVKLAATMCWGADPVVRRHFALAPLPPDPGTWRTW